MYARSFSYSSTSTSIKRTCWRKRGEQEEETKTETVFAFSILLPKYIAPSPCKGIQGSGFQELDASLCWWNQDSGFQSLVVFRIPWAVSCIPKAQDSGFHEQNFQLFQIPQARFPYMVRTVRHHSNVLLWTFYGSSNMTAGSLSQSRRKLQL